MKKHIIHIFMLVFIVSVQGLQSQIIKYEYDEAGNRTHRYYTTVTLSRASSYKSDTIPAPQKELIGTREVLIYPNPTQGALKIEIKGSLPETPTQFILTDMGGHILATNRNSDYIYVYDMSTFPAGVYFLRVIVEGVRKDWKIIKE